MSLELKDQYDKIYKYCYFKLRNQEVAEDITQETFLSFFDHADYISRGKPLAYLYTIAKHKCIDYCRKAVSLPLDDNLPSVDDTEALDTSIAVKQAVATLPDDQQEVILLRFSNGLGIGEIAAILEISRFAVNRKMNVALKAMKTILD